MVIATLITACQQKVLRSEDPYTMDDVYNNVNNFRNGEKDAVKILRDGLRTNYTLGQRDPLLPIRLPELVAPIWHFNYLHPATNSRIEGHWEHLIIQEPQWSE